MKQNESYKNTTLAVAGITGTIYLTKLLPANKSREYPIMSDKRYADMAAYEAWIMAL